MTTALEGLSILDFSQGMAGPLATMVLAENGAEVTKIEPPNGDWARREPAFGFWNRGKRSVVLDLAGGADRRRAQELAAASDVVVEGFRPGVAERLGIGYEDLAASNPGLVYCSISGFGAAPALAGVRAYEGIVAAMTGLWNGLDEIQGVGAGMRRDHPVFKVAAVYSYAASQLAVQAIISALFVREQGGGGQRVSTSLLRAPLSC